MLMCFSRVPPDVGYVNKSLNGVLVLEIACTFDLFAEQTFFFFCFFSLQKEKKIMKASSTCGLGLMCICAGSCLTAS